MSLLHPTPADTALEELSFDGQYRPRDRVMFCRYGEGFFANCTVTLWNILEVARRHQKYPLRIDYSAGFGQYRNIGTALENRGDLYPLFFVTEPDRLSSLAPPPGENPDHHGVYRDIDYRYYNELISAYFAPSDAIRQRSDRLREKYHIDLDKVILVWYRGTDKISEVAIAEPEAYLKQAQAILDKHPDHKVWIQTEDARVRELFSQHFGQRCILISELPPSSVGGDVHNLPPEEALIDRLELANNLLALVMLGSKARHIICHTGNISFWLCLCRGHTQGVQQFDRQGALPPSSHARNPMHWLRKLRDRLKARL